MTLPMAMSGCLRRAATMEVASSWHRRSGGDDGETDDGFADAKERCQADGIIDQQPRTDHEHEQTTDDEGEVAPGAADLFWHGLGKLIFDLGAGFPAREADVEHTVNDDAGKRAARPRRG